jgi:hypothetical protein
MVKNPELIPLFEKLKKLLKPYEDGMFHKHNESGNYDLWSKKEIEIAGRKRKEVFFVGIIIQKHYVGLYYMPVYTDTDIKKVFKSELLSTLKGKSCFYIKKDDPVLMSQIKDALRIGYNLYKKRGWV